jgi:hypothetical protein
MASRYLDGPQRPEPRVPDALAEALVEALAIDLASGQLRKEAFERRLGVIAGMRRVQPCEVIPEISGQALAIIEGRHRVFHVEHSAAARTRPVGPCPCACNSGGFCGGCGHAGCGGR